MCWFLAVRTIGITFAVKQQYKIRTFDGFAHFSFVVDYGWMIGDL